MVVSPAGVDARLREFHEEGKRGKVHRLPIPPGVFSDSFEPPARAVLDAWGVARLPLAGILGRHVLLERRGWTVVSAYGPEAALHYYYDEAGALVAWSYGWVSWTWELDRVQSGYLVSLCQGLVAEGGELASLLYWGAKLHAEALPGLEAAARADADDAAAPPDRMPVAEYARLRFQAFGGQVAERLAQAKSQAARQLLDARVRVRLGALRALVAGGASGAWRDLAREALEA